MLGSDALRDKFTLKFNMNDPSATLSSNSSGWRKTFVGPNGPRAGWRLLIFAAIFSPLFYAASAIVDAMNRRLKADPESPLGVLILMGTFAVAVLLASWLMAKIEGRSLADYGLPWRRAFCKQFWQGAAISFASLTIFLAVLRFAGAFSFGFPGLHGLDILKYGAIWSLPVFLGALLEDFFYRGYLLFTLSTGIGFWPAAVVSSLWMGGMHYLNPGGAHGLGPIAATEYCLVTCLVLRRTGDLWMPLGLHTAWNWGELFFYGVPSSGFTGRPHFLNSSFHGPEWLTGGTFGQDGTWPSLALLTIWGIVFSVWLRGVKYPNPAAIPDPRRVARSRAVEAGSRS